MRFKTVSGSEYEIVDHPSGKVVRRLNTRHEKRADGRFVRLLNEPVIEVGGVAVLTLESLSVYGSDDVIYGTDYVGTPLEEVNPFTTRITSTVVEVEND